MVTAAFWAVHCVIRKKFFLVDLEMNMSMNITEVKRSVYHLRDPADALTIELAVISQKISRTQSLTLSTAPSLMCLVLSSSANI